MCLFDNLRLRVTRELTQSKRFIAFAGGCREYAPIEDRHSTPAITDSPAGSQIIAGAGDPGAARSQMLSNLFMRKRQRMPIGSVMNHQ